MYDVPQQRSSHAAPVLRGAGIAIAPALVISLVVAASVTLETSPLLGIAAGCAAIAAIGIVEDVRGVPIRLRLAGQALIGAALAGMLLASGNSSWILAVCAVLLVPVSVNVTNFMDGVDLLSGLHGVVFGVAFSVSGLVLGLDWMWLAGVALAVAFGVFLPFNVRARRRMFLGDSGSYLLGGAYAFIGVLALAAGAPALSVATPITIYLADTATTLVRRISTGKDWRTSHREHHYHQLEDLGWPHYAVSVFVAALSAVCSAIGIWAGSDLARIAIVIPMLAVIAVAYLRLPSFLRRRIAGASK
ncbi:UDP-phosphate glycosyltransferase [Microbacterium sp. PRC9]|uniref:UDP-phosphate glycosyltransferase n=1 Tax=Microbacterium sp. PRC9 TaxID=2962591 RepID=UPI0028827D22|nr:UDP-phosphate glycosyltransferase [Microbacterium sp. PRC9]MDT0141472.1 UDP-phosphate glycosyltransferase [Microbacterium sp. PRC9]